MSLQSINVGTTANDHTGDSLRTAMTKANQPLGYNSTTHAWTNSDWQAAMADYLTNNAPSYWQIDGGTGNLIYPNGSPVIQITPTGGLVLSDSSTLTPDGSGHLIYSGLLGMGIAAWDKYPYEAFVCSTAGDVKLGIYSQYEAADGSAGADLLFGFPRVVDNAGYAPGFGWQFIPDPASSGSRLRCNYVERDTSGYVVAANPDILDIYGDSHVVMQGPLYVTNDMEVNYGHGFILQSPSGYRYRLTVDDSGSLGTTGPL